MDALGLADKIERLPGVGPKRAQDFHRMGISTIDDLVTFWPRRHLDRTEVTPISHLTGNFTGTVRGRIRSVSNHYLSAKRSYLRVALEDNTGTLELTFFHANWLKQQLLPGREMMVTGRVDAFRGRLGMTHPEFEMLEKDHPPRLGLIPTYPLSGDLKQRFVQDLQMRVIPQWASQVGDPLPKEILQQEGLVERPWAVLHEHLPASVEDLERARRRLVFDEFLRMSLAVLWLHRPDSIEVAPRLNPDVLVVERFRETLPFQLTAGQVAVWEEISSDLAQPQPMARLLQGDVGSGKTILAVLSMVTAVGSGYQAALMAPTELLAEQHYLLLQQLLAPLDIEVVLITARGPDRRHAEERIRSTEPLIAVGTQALLSDRIHFGRLAMVVVDEQHRFGVRQRAGLGEKGVFPHMLVMTATPIPRTLALTVYGDLEVSRITGLPPGRKPIQTVHLSMKDRRQAYQRVMDEVRRGHQAYVICPLVEESEEGQGKAATLLAEGMQRIPGWRVGLIHGRMTQQEKSQVMERFKERDIDVLVGTTILEVGVDVPNATVMVVEEADRFGLAQLHQLRGRVGRGQHPGACYLLADPATVEGQSRIQALVESQDGLRLAEQDLEIRGPGEVLGMRQHGVAGFQLANPLKDLALLERARQVARHILSVDPELRQSEWQPLKAWVFSAIADALPGHVLH